MNNYFYLAVTLFNRTLINFAIVTLIVIFLLFEVFAEKSKYVNNTPEMKKAILFIGVIIIAIFVCLYFFVKIS